MDIGRDRLIADQERKGSPRVDAAWIAEFLHTAEKDGFSGFVDEKGGLWELYDPETGLSASGDIWKGMPLSTDKGGGYVTPFDVMAEPEELMDRAVGPGWEDMYEVWQEYLPMDEEDGVHWTKEKARPPRSCPHDRHLARESEGFPFVWSIWRGDERVERSEGAFKTYRDAYDSMLDYVLDYQRDRFSYPDVAGQRRPLRLVAKFGPESIVLSGPDGDFEYRVEADEGEEA